MNEAFRDKFVEQLTAVASKEQGSWTEAWAKKIMELGKDGEEEILGALHKAMQMKFGHAMAGKMIDEIRKLVHEQMAGGGPGKKRRDKK